MTREEAIYELGSANQGYLLKDMINEIYDDFDKELDKARKEGYKAAAEDCLILLNGKDNKWT